MEPVESEKHPCLGICGWVVWWLGTAAWSIWCIYTVYVEWTSLIHSVGGLCLALTLMVGAIMCPVALLFLIFYAQPPPPNQESYLPMHTSSERCAWRRVAVWGGVGLHVCVGCVGIVMQWRTRGTAWYLSIAIMMIHSPLLLVMRSRPLVA